MRARYLSGIVAAVLAVSACAGGSTPSPIVSGGPASGGPAPSAAVPTGASSSAGAIQITLGTDTDAGLKFDPASISVPAGAAVTVTFDNRATVPHNLTFQAPINAASAAVVAPGTTETVTFTAPAAGEYAFVCTIHPGMGGTLIVTGG